MYGSEISASSGAIRVVSSQTAGRPSGVTTPLPLLDLVEDRLRDRVARPERVRELLAVGVQQHGAVGARRLRDRVALHRRRPRAAVRVVLERVEIARLGARVERDARHLARRVRMVRRELAARLGLARSSARRRRGRRRSPRRRAVPRRRRTTRASRCALGSSPVKSVMRRARCRSPPRTPRAAPS